jgi:hypothetical protein
MLRIYDDAKSLANYNATRYRSMVAAHGGLEAARILVRADTVSDGYIALWERGHLELTVEALILKPEWHPLFTSEERAIARERLRKYEYQGDLGEG